MGPGSPNGYSYYAGVGAVRAIVGGQGVANVAALVQSVLVEGRVEIQERGRGAEGHVEGAAESIQVGFDHQIWGLIVHLQLFCTCQTILFHSAEC